LSIAFAAPREPRCQSFREAFRRKPKTRLDLSISNGQGVIKVRRIREIPHAELIQPFERASFRLSLNGYIHIEFLRVHVFGVGNNVRARGP